MWLIRAALRRPYTILVAVITVALTAGFAVNRMRADIFPDLDLPVIYVAQPYGGMSPAQMEGFITYYYEYHFLYINGIESVESKSIQNTSLLKLTFHPGTDMAEALKVMALSGHGMAFLPESAVREEVAQGKLVRAESARGLPLSIDMEIRLYREKPGENGGERRGAGARRKRQLVDQVWSTLVAA